jgi:hypothetical protein
MHRSRGDEREQWLLVAGRVVFAASLELCGEQRGDPWSVRDEAGLAELPTADDEQRPGRVEITEPQSAHLDGAQSEPVAQREHRAVGGPALHGPGVVGQCAGGVEQSRGLAGIE